VDLPAQLDPVSTSSIREEWQTVAKGCQRFGGVDGEPPDVRSGKAAGMDLCLHLVRTDHGTAVANALARALVVPPHRPGGQAQFIPAAVGHGPDHVLGDLLPWALERIEHPLTVRDLAREAGTSSRNLARHFNAVTGVSPLRWLLTQRVRRAQELLETSDLGVEQIAARPGMGTATTLRRHFNQQLGVPPETYRRTFRP
jgi:transcriptional regulator GlxA family with amidase domain